ncbi:bacterial regulatory helix-turn-helix, lysR family protein [Burkholderia pseudomallei MSHR435]|nr:bacterial regulatory helix-turn-helix, lysR family protein [Burkholderia pseudomallei MSHR435]
MRDLNDLYYFVQVVDHGGFAPAGRALNLPKSKLSRRIARLEERIGMRLIQRSTRRFAVTDIGQTYYAHCRAMLVEADAADEAVALVRTEPRGIVRMTCPVALLDALVGDMIAAFMAECPLVEIHLEETNRRVDVVGEGIDIALRVRPPPLEDSDLALACSPSAGNASLRARGSSSAPAPRHACPPISPRYRASRSACRRTNMSGICAARTARMRRSIIARGSSRAGCSRCARRPSRASASFSCRR